MREAVDVLGVRGRRARSSSRTRAPASTSAAARSAQRQRRRSARRACAGSATPAGPGRPSAARAAPARSSRRPACVMSRAAEADRAGGRVDEPRDQRADQRRLPAARTRRRSPSVSPSCERERDVVDGVHAPTVRSISAPRRTGKCTSRCSTSSSGAPSSPATSPERASAVRRHDRSRSVAPLVLERRASSGRVRRESGARLERRHLRAAVERVRAARPEVAARAAACSSDGGDAGDRRQPRRAVAVQRARSSPAAPTCTGAAGRRRARRASPARRPGRRT